MAWGPERQRIGHRLADLIAAVRERYVKAYWALNSSGDLPTYLLSNGTESDTPTAAQFNGMDATGVYENVMRLREAIERLYAVDVTKLNTEKAECLYYADPSMSYVQVDETVVWSTTVADAWHSEACWNELKAKVEALGACRWVLPDGYSDSVPIQVVYRESLISWGDVADQGDQEEEFENRDALFAALHTFGCGISNYGRFAAIGGHSLDADELSWVHVKSATHVIDTSMLDGTVVSLSVKFESWARLGTGTGGVSNYGARLPNNSIWEELAVNEVSLEDFDTWMLGVFEKSYYDTNLISGDVLNLRFDLSLDYDAPYTEPLARADYPYDYHPSTYSVLWRDFRVTVDMNFAEIEGGAV